METLNKFLGLKSILFAFLLLLGIGSLCKKICEQIGKMAICPNTCLGLTVPPRPTAGNGDNLDAIKISLRRITEIMHLILHQAYCTRAVQALLLFLYFHKVLTSQFKHGLTVGLQ